MQRLASIPLKTAKNLVSLVSFCKICLGFRDHFTMRTGRFPDGPAPLAPSGHPLLHSEWSRESPRLCARLAPCNQIGAPSSRSARTGFLATGRAGARRSGYWAGMGRGGVFEGFNRVSSGNGIRQGYRAAMSARLAATARPFTRAPGVRPSISALASLTVVSKRDSTLRPLSSTCTWQRSALALDHSAAPLIEIKKRA